MRDLADGAAAPIFRADENTTFTAFAGFEAAGGERSRARSAVGSGNRAERRQCSRDRRVPGIETAVCTRPRGDDGDSSIG
jgi:hypothetical protein